MECTKKNITIKHNNQHAKTYSYDQVYGPLSTQPDVYTGMTSVTCTAYKLVLEFINCNPPEFKGFEVYNQKFHFEILL